MQQGNSRILSLSTRSACRSAIRIAAAALVLASTMLAQDKKARDPGPRPNPASAIPSPVPGLDQNEMALFNESLLRVSELEGTCDTCAQQPQGVPPIDPDPKNPFSPLKLVNSAGMGPVFNADQCFICHSQPAIGGSSPAVNPAQVIAHRLVVSFFVVCLVCALGRVGFRWVGGGRGGGRTFIVEERWIRLSIARQPEGKSIVSNVLLRNAEYVSRVSSKSIAILNIQV